MSREANVLVYVMMLGAWEITHRRIDVWGSTPSGDEETEEQRARRGRLADALDKLDVMVSEDDVFLVNEIAGT